MPFRDSQPHKNHAGLGRLHTRYQRRLQNKYHEGSQSPYFRVYAVAIFVRRNFERFNLGVDMLNKDSFTGNTPVIRFFSAIFSAP
jgi:hypothetical protein